MRGRCCVCLGVPFSKIRGYIDEIEIEMTYCETCCRFAFESNDKHFTSRCFEYLECQAFLPKRDVARKIVAESLLFTHTFTSLRFH